MTNQRLKQLMLNTGVQYAEGSPLLLEACALYLDTASNNCIAQLKWKNIDPRSVKAVMIELDCFDAFDQKLEHVPFQYNGILITQGTEFGGKTPVLIKNNKAVRYDVFIKAVSFTDDTIWHSDSLSPYTALPAAKPPVLTGELYDQYKRDLSNQRIRVAAEYTPQNAMGLWQCGCGSWQLKGTPCLKCQTTFDFLNAAAQPSVLEAHLAEYEAEQERLRIEAEKRAEEERIAREKAEEERKRKEEEQRIRQEQERLKQEKLEQELKKKKRKIAIIAAALLLVAVGAGCAIKLYFIPQKHYNDALKLMEEGKYTEAYDAFNALGNYSDSETRMSQVQANANFAQGNYEEVNKIYATLDDKYQTHADDLKGIYDGAAAMIEEGKYKEASEAFASLGSYSDAASRIGEPYYVQAETLLASGEYEASSKAFKAAGKYKDAADRVLEPYYVQAEALQAEGKIDEASDAFAALGNYRDAIDRRWEPYAEHAAALLEAGDFDSATAAYMALYERSDNAYQSALEMAQESTYRKAAALEADGQPDAALAVYETITDYKDALQKQQSIHMAKGQAALQAMNLEAARKEFTACGQTDEAAAQIDALDTYEGAVKALKAANYAHARAAFLSLEDYLDSPAQVVNCNAAEYAAAAEYYDNGQLAAAYAFFNDLGDYSDSKARATGITDAYTAANDLLNSGKYDEAIEAFRALKDYSDSKEKVNIACYSKAESEEEAGNYDNAIEIFTELGDYRDCTEKVVSVRYAKAEALAERGEKVAAEAEYAQIPEYGDVADKLVTLRTELGKEALDNKEYNDALAYYLGMPQTDDVKELEYTLAQTCYDDGNYEYATKAYELLGQYELSVSKLPVSRYAWANQLFENGQYSQAAEQFALLGDMTDSAQRANESTYQLGLQQMNAKEYEASKATFATIPDYNDSSAMIHECDYRGAMDQMEAGNYAEATELFTKLGNYSESDTQRQECIYRQGCAGRDEKDYKSAEDFFASIPGYKDSDAQKNSCIYEQAEALKATGSYSEAEKRYEELGNYKDSPEKVTACIRAQADALFDVGNYASAETVYTRIMDIDDNADRYKECRLRQGKACIDTGDYSGALEFVEGLDYADSENLMGKCYDALGYAAHAKGDTEEAVRLYSKAIKYPGVQATLYDIGKDYASTNQNTKAIETFWACGDYESARTTLIELADLLAQSGNSQDAMIACYSIGDREKASGLMSEKDIPDIQKALGAYTIFEDGSFTNAILYEHANTLISIDSTAAFDLFAEILDYRDVKTIMRSTAQLSDAAEGYIERADDCFIKKDYQQALELYRIAGVAGKPVRERMQHIDFMEFLTAPGRRITFGSYPQASNNATPVMWRLMGIENGNALFISEELLDYSTYEDNGVASWLSRARDTMFSEAEKPVVKTFDIPSQNQLEKYLPEKEDRKAKPTKYAEQVRSNKKTWKQGQYVWTKTKASGRYYGDYYVVYDPTNGVVDTYGEDYDDYQYLRPYIALSLNHELASLLMDGSYHFYDKQGKEVTFEPQDYSDIPTDAVDGFTDSLMRDRPEDTATQSKANSDTASESVGESLIEKESESKEDAPDAKFHPGTYTGVGLGLGDITVEITVDQEKITNAKIVGKNEVLGQANFPKYEAMLIGRSDGNIDRISGATVSYNGLKDALEEALRNAYVKAASEQDSQSEATPEEVEDKVEDDIPIGDLLPDDAPWGISRDAFLEQNPSGSTECEIGTKPGLRTSGIKVGAYTMDRYHVFGEKIPDSKGKKYYGLSKITYILSASDPAFKDLKSVHEALIAAMEKEIGEPDSQSKSVTTWEEDAYQIEIGRAKVSKYTGKDDSTVVIIFTGKDISMAESASKDTTESESHINLKNGWYISDDGKFGIKPLSLESYYWDSSYSLEIEIRDEASGDIVLETELTLEKDGEMELVKEGAIQDFVYAGNGKYEFKVVCEIRIDDDISIQRSQGFSFTVE